MKIAVFSSQRYEKQILTNHAEKYQQQLVFFEPALNNETVKLAEGYSAVCCFVNDDINANVIAALAKYGVKLIALRCAGFNNVDLDAAKKHKITVVRVPKYSPYAVAEFAMTLVLSLNRKVTRAFNRVRDNNFLLDGLLGFDLHKKTIGVVGTGAIGAAFANIALGFGCKVIAYDLYPNEACLQAGVKYVDLEKIYQDSDVISLHCPLTKETHYMINQHSIEKMKQGVMIINTSRGGLLDTKAVINGLKSQQVGYLGLDVYEEEESIFFKDHEADIIQDDVFARLLTFPNVIVTGHQAFFTREALINIADTSMKNIQAFEKQAPINLVQ